MLVSARISRGGHGAPAELLVAWLDKRYELVISEMLLTELKFVLLRPKFRRYTSPEEVAEYVDLLRHNALFVADPPATLEPLTPDPKDDYLVSIARFTEAHVLVSGDHHLTEISDARPPIVTPRAFVAILDSSH